MNTTANTRAALQTHPQNRLAALALAGVMTAALMLGANGLADSATTQVQVAQQQVQPLQLQQPA
jgi:redox-regulated HSP33 family molecular chaperone